jgi:hybrid cluster-associated redox disulfide protein
MKKTKIGKITKSTKIGKILKINPKAGEILAEEGLHCAMCPMAAEETLEQACKSYGISTAKILKKLAF